MRSELKIRVGFFSIDWSFFLLALLLPMSEGLQFDYALVYCAAIAVAITIHEFGHWAALRFQHIDSEITLWIFGGLTSHQRVPRSRIGNIVVSAAGPALGFGAALALRPLRNDIMQATNFNLHIFGGLVWFDRVCVVWGFVNLLPVLPLDGGNIVQHLCEGRTDPLVPHKISLVTAIAAAAWAFTHDESYLGFIALLLAFRSYSSLKGQGSGWAESRITRPPRKKAAKRHRKAADEAKLTNPVEVLLARGEEAMIDGSAGRALQVADEITPMACTFEQRIDLASLRAWAELMRRNAAAANEILAHHHVEPRHVNGLLAACLELGYDTRTVSPHVLEYVDGALAGGVAGRRPYGVAPSTAATLLSGPDVLEALRSRYANDQLRREALASVYRRGGRPEAADRILAPLS